MKHFLKIAEGVDVMPLLHAVSVQPDLWSENRMRQTFAPDSPHVDVEDIWLRFSELDEPAGVGDDLETVDYPAFARLPMARPIVFDLARRVEAERIGRVMITKLAPGKRILPHADVLGAYASYYSRYHVPLQGLPGSLFRAGDEQVCMRTGEVWWFDASAPHEVINNSADDRLHLIVDLKVAR